MSKIAKGLAVSTLAAGAMVLAGASPVSANAYYKSYSNPHKGNYASNSVNFNEKYDKSSSLFYSLKESEKKQNSEHFNYNSDDRRWNDDKRWGDTCKHDDKKNRHGNDWGQHDKWNKHDDKKHWGQHDGKQKHWDDRGNDCKHHGKQAKHDKQRGGHGNNVSINAYKDNSYAKKYEETKAAKSNESYASNYSQHNDRGNYGGWNKYGKHGNQGKKGNFASSNVQASVNYNKEKSYDATVKAEVAHSASVGTSVNLSNYGPHGSRSNSVSAYENVNHYAKVEAAVSEYEKQQSSVNYSANTANANFGGYGGKGGYGNTAMTSVNYSAESSSEKSRQVTYSAEESTSYSSGFSSNNTSNQGGYGHKMDHADD